MKRIFPILCSVFAFVVISCAGSSTPNRYYMLAGENISKAVQSLPYRLVIQKFAVDPAYAQPNIVYRESPYEFMSYGNDFWASSPERQVENLFADAFEKSGLFASVERRASEIPDFELSGVLNALEEIDTDSSASYARVAVELSLRSGKTGKTVWKRSFDERQKLESRKPVEVAKAASILVNRYAGTALREIGENLGENPL